MKWLLGSVGVTATLTIAIAVYHAAYTPAAVPPPRHAPIPYPGPTSARLDAGGWETVQHVVGLRTEALAPKRTALYRSFAAYMGLQGLISLRPVLPGPCALAVLYLYDNLRDLRNAYPGEDWQPLRLLIRRQPSLQACAPRVAARTELVT